MRRKMKEDREAVVAANRLRQENQKEEAPVKNPEDKKGD
jgi:hypothetical protein